MILWFVLAAMTLAVLLVLLFPLLRARVGGIGRRAHDLAVYRDQLRELEVDAERGTVSLDEADASRREIERRLLRADAADSPDLADRPAWRSATAALLALAVPVLAAAVYSGLGAPGLPSHRPSPGTATDRAAGPPAAPNEDMTGLAERLALRLANQPDDRAGWILLGRTEWELGRFDAAARAYQQAAALDGEDAGLQMALGEARIFAAQGTVTPAAAAAFQKTLRLDPRHPGARYYLALKDSQAGLDRAAYRAWLGLAQDSPADAPWIGPLRQRLEEVADRLGSDLEADWPAHLKTAGAAPAPATAPATSGPGPSRADVEAAQQMSAGERAQFIRSMVQRLADRLAENPDDFEGWMRLGRAYGVLQEKAKAAEALGNAARLRPDDAQVLTQHARALIEAADPNAPPPPAAIAAFRKVLAREPGQPEALWFVGLAEARAGNTAGAIEAWQRLLTRLDPKSPQYSEVKARIDEAKRR